ncbi:MAG: TerB family tellurite resistance protein [Bacteroidales bacterium]
MEEKLSLLTELIKLARSDKDLRQEEYDFLLQIAESLEVPREEFTGLFEQYIEFSPPKSEFERILQFQRLILLMNVDREARPEEIKTLKGIAIRLGLNPMATNAVLDQMTKHPNGVVPADKLVEIFKRHYN